MKPCGVSFFGLMLALLTGTQADAAEQMIFGPVKYDVKDRYGNRTSTPPPSRQNTQ
jgi:hypothetical protein